jgi:hypothetical protein
MVFSNMVSEARRVIQESKEKVQGLEQIAQEVYKQACIRIQELVNVAESLYQTNCSKTSEIEKLHMEVQSTRDQLEVQINRNQVMVSQITQFESQMYNFQNLFGHKAAEITRLISEVSRLQSSEARLEESLAALSAAPSSVAARVEARRTSAPVDVASGNLSGAVEDRVVEVPNEPHATVFQSSMEQRMDSMMAAIQCLSDRMGYYEHNGTEASRSSDCSWPSCTTS